MLTLQAAPSNTSQKLMPEQEIKKPEKVQTHIEKLKAAIAELQETTEVDIPELPSALISAYEILIPQLAKQEILQLETTEVSEDLLKEFAQKHLEIYSLAVPELGDLLIGTDFTLSENDSLEQKLLERFPQIAQDETLLNQLFDQALNQIPSKEIHLEFNQLDIRSCMYGGKSTNSFLLFNYLNSKGYRTGYFIADVMGESQISARSLPEERNRIRSATRFGENFPIDENTLENFDIILLDEFSFLPEKAVRNFLDVCKQKNIKVVLTGLNKNHKGFPTTPYKPDSTLLEDSLHYKCYAFVMPNERRKISYDPKGERTIRYFKLPTLPWIYDAGILPDITSKVYEQLVHYKTAFKGQTLSELLSENPEIIQALESEEVQFFEYQLLKALKLHYGYDILE